jgi:hypothetical protein
MLTDSDIALKHGSSTYMGRTELGAILMNMSMIMTMLFSAIVLIRNELHADNSVEFNAEVEAKVKKGARLRTRIVLSKPS